jgi:peptidoglycan hydrolase CwlO-like protein
MSKKNKATMELDIVMLKRNVADLQQQLGNANKRIAELTSELDRKLGYESRIAELTSELHSKQEALLNINKIYSKTTQRDILLKRK